MFVLSIASSQAYITTTLTQDRCWEREGSSTAGVPDGTNLCENPADVDDNDGSYEVTSQGSNNYAELRTAHNFNAPNDCNLLGVEACVDFYTGNLDVCTGVNVSRDGGTSWSSAFGTCPLSDSGIVCYDVTALRNWASDCSDFQNNQSEVLIELSYRGNNDLFTDYVRYQINYTTTPNLTKPLIIPIQPYNNDTLNCSTNITDAEEDPLTVNFTWYINGVQDNTYDTSVVCANNTECFTDTIVPSSALTVGDRWICSAVVYDGYVNSNWRNSTEVTIPNRAPTVDNVTINEGQAIDLLAGQNTTVTCNGTVTEYDGFSDIFNINATFFNTDLGKTAESPDNRSNHYTNSSCSFTNSPGFLQNYSCSFPVSYYALNGSWTCEVTIIDFNNSVDILQNSTNINPLTAIGVSTEVIDYGQIQVGGTSPEQTLTVFNFGNVDLDLEIFAYADNINDDLALNCSTGDIPLTYERYNLTSGLSFSLMSPISGFSSPVNLDFNLSKRVWDDPESSKSTYWRLRIPSFRQGRCNGKLVFTGIPN